MDQFYSYCLFDKRSKYYGNLHPKESNFFKTLNIFFYKFIICLIYCLIILIELYNGVL